MSDKNLVLGVESVRSNVPSVLKLMEEDQELRDFVRLIRDENFRSKAVQLLEERLRSKEKVEN